MSRYNKTKTFENNESFYSSLLEERDLNSVLQMETVILHHPTVEQRRLLKTNRHIWKYGDRLYNLANQYYSNPEHWWIIAWYNGYPTEANIPIGAVLYIPLSLEQVIEVLGL